MLVAHTFEKNLRFEKKIEDEFKFEKTFVWWHSLVRKAQIFWEISDFEKVSSLVAPRPDVYEQTEAVADHPTINNDRY